MGGQFHNKNASNPCQLQEGLMRIGRRHAVVSLLGMVLSLTFLFIELLGNDICGIIIPLS